LRIGTVRYLPRGIGKKDYARLNYFDIWLPQLAPSRQLLRRYGRLEGPAGSFFRQYRAEMTQPECRPLIALLAGVSERTPISIGCYCEEESSCHRSVLLKLIRAAGR
jgi:uncharacterized protein YeaO (DUF488 family)